MVNLGSLKIFNNMRRDLRRQFAIIGLGRFGRSVCQTLHSLGYEVIGTDIDEKRVAQVLQDQQASNAVQLDSTEPTALKQAGIFEFDTVIVAIGNYLQESIVTTLNLKEAGVKQVVAKASSEIHGKLLEKVGADLVVFPEHDAGKSLAYTLTKPAIIDRFELDPEHSIVEIAVPPEFHNKTLAELEIRKRYGLNIIAVADLTDKDKFVITPPPNQYLYEGLTMVVVGSNKAIKKLPI